MESFGRYTLLSVLGRGGMGEVWLARGPGSETPFVVKRLLPTLTSNEDMLRGFLDETRIASLLNHPDIVRIDELGEVAGEWFVRMEFVDGASLAHVHKMSIRAGERLPLGVAVEVAARMARALDHAHHATDLDGRALNIVHRDVSPQNILLGHEGEVKLIDFGVARAEQRYQRTTPGTLKGKLSYMAPEQAQGLDLDGRTDLFALGIVLWEMLAGRRLFKGETPLETLAAVVHAHIAPPSSERPLPKELDEVTLRALAREPDARFARGNDLAEALETVAEQYGLETGPAAVQGLVRRFGPPKGQAPAPLTEGSGEWNPDSAIIASPENIGAGVPVDDTAFVGRVAELAQVHQLFSGDARLVTVQGPGGVGKSRLAREVARQRRNQLNGKVWVVDVSSATDTESVCLAVCETLGVALPPGNAVDAVGRVLATRRSCLVVLDGAEGVAEVVGAVAPRWLELARDATLLVCSRIATGARGEVLFELGPLSTEAGPRGNDAVQLFLDRAQAALKDRPLDAAERAALDELVRQLEGMPLAIELKAAQVARLPRAMVLHSLKHDGGGRGGLDRAFKESWAQLPAEDRRVLAQLACFQGGFSTESAEGVVRLTDPKADVVDVLERLRSVSLVRAGFVRGTTHLRYSLFETIRARAAEADPDVAAEARARHADFFLAFGESHGPDAERGGTRLDALAIERDNLLAAVRWLKSQPPPANEKALRVLVALDPLFIVRGPFDAHLRLLDEVLGTLEDPSVRRPGLEARARLLMGRGRAAEAVRDMHAVLKGTLSRKDQGRALSYLANALKASGDLAGAQETFERARRFLEAAGDERMLGRTLGLMGNVAREQGRLDDALALLTEGLALHEKTDDRRFMAVAQTNLGVLQQVRGDWPRAEQHLTRAVDLHRAMGNRRSEGIAVANLADLERDRGNGARALVLYRKAVAINRETGNQRFEGICLVNVAMLRAEALERDEALDAANEAMALSRSAGDAKHEALALALRGAVRANQGEASAAAADLARARELTARTGDEGFTAAVSLYQVPLDLAEAAVADTAGRAGPANEHRAAAGQRLSAAIAPGAQGSQAERFEHVRMALRVVKALAKG